MGYWLLSDMTTPHAYDSTLMFGTNFKYMVAWLKRYNSLHGEIYTPTWRLLPWKTWQVLGSTQDHVHMNIKDYSMVGTATFF